MTAEPILEMERCPAEGAHVWALVAMCSLHLSRTNSQSCQITVMGNAETAARERVATYMLVEVTR